MDKSFNAQFASFLSLDNDAFIATKLAAALASIARFDIWRLIEVDSHGHTTAIDFRNPAKPTQGCRGADLTRDPIGEMSEKYTGEGFFSSEEVAPRGLMVTPYHDQAMQHGLTLTDHVGFVARLDNGNCVCLSLSRSDLFPMFSKAETEKFRAAAPLVVHGLKELGTPTSTRTDQREEQHQIDTPNVRELLLQSSGFTTLSKRQRDVAHLLFEGQSAKSIARSLGISPGTVRNHIKHIYLKLRLNSRGEFYSHCVGELTRAGIAGALVSGETAGVTRAYTA